MSSFSGKLIMQGAASGQIGNATEGVEVVSFRYQAHSPRDIYSGRATGRTQGNLVELELNIAGPILQYFNALSHNEQLEGRVEFNNIDERSTLMRVHLRRANCVHFEQTFHNNQPRAFNVILKLVTDEIEFEWIDGGISVVADFSYEHAR